MDVILKVNFTMNRLKEVLEELGISQKEFGEQTGLPKQYVSNLCNNRSQPSLKTLNKWANYLDIDVRCLVKSNKTSDTKKSNDK